MGGESGQVSSMRSSYPRMAARPKGKQIHHIYRDRLRQFTDGGQYRKQGLLDKIDEARVSGDPHVRLEVYSPPDLTRPTFKEATSHKFRDTRIGQSFGPSWSTHWFRVHLTVPSKLLKANHLELQWDAGNEGLIWTEHGEPLQGLTGSGERIEWILPKAFRDGKEHVFYIEMACNGMFGNATSDSIQPPDPNRYFQLQKADIVAVDMEARQLRVDFGIIGDAAREFSEDSWQEHEALQVCNDIMDLFIAGNGTHETIVECRKLAEKYIGDKINGPEVYDGDDGAIVNAIGNCHIDTCWLWPWAETKRKIARSWLNQCDLLERYPEHRFVASQAQQYKWLETLYPSAFDRVKSKIKEGNFMTIGGSWVEHDTNMPSGESLVRQFLYGQRFYESRFGQRCTTFWLPDTFGYSTQLPQLCRLAGMSRFFTQKLSWNNINNFPHTTFNWVSLDGSQVLCHMAPCETYTAEAHFGDVARSVSQHKSLDQDNTSLLPFGKGDGGGGPTWEHLEKLRRCRGLSDKVGLLPKVKVGGSVEDFFAGIEKKVRNGTELVTWYGELYFELHRGTYTTQANNKRNNRYAEALLHDIEYLATLASIQDSVRGTSTGYKYPKKEIDDIWEDVLLCQFHDCLPGSCIEMCYRDSDELYAKVFKSGYQLKHKALSALGFDDESDVNSTQVALNTRHRLAPGIAGGRDRWGRRVYGISDRETGLNEIHSFEAGPLSATASIREIGHDVFLLSNSQYDVEVTHGAITSLYDKRAKREVVPKGSKANQLVIFDDKPLYWQAWDVEVFHLQSREELHATTPSSVTESGPHRVAVTTTYKISEESSIQTTVSLCAVADESQECYVEVEAEVDWHETMKFLKVEFPVDVRNTEASYETQFGIVRRPTNYNTSWDMAKFEVCCHKWADLSEHGYGVSILNESKYGFAVAGNLMRLSLLRAPKAPDAHADMGRHTMRWAIMPHKGLLDSRTVRAGFEFNFPPSIHSHPKISDVKDLMSSFRLSKHSDDGLVLDTIKRGEDDEDVSRGELPKKHGRNVVVRIYDSLGGRARGVIETGAVKIQKAWKCNLLEDDLEEMHVGSDGEVAIEVGAFEVASYRLLLA